MALLFVIQDELWPIAINFLHTFILYRAPVVGQAHPYVINSHGRPVPVDQSGEEGSPPMRDRQASSRHTARMLLGNVSPDDILDITCKLCSETKYGSVHAFKKHFYKVPCYTIRLFIFY